MPNPLSRNMSSDEAMTCYHCVAKHECTVNIMLLPFQLKKFAHWAHDVGAKVLVDACQSVPHMVVDVQSLNVGFLVASSHKMCGRIGIGFLYDKNGGEMISDVYLDHSTYADPPSRSEAGTPAIGKAIGLGAAIDYLSGIGMQTIHNYEITQYSN
ncbi:hypothetical protein K1719_041314 [Acacia pycnantha]|nr:hypothetical protein K1719_041314 [Acacia pycnantha]